MPARKPASKAVKAKKPAPKPAAAKKAAPARKTPVAPPAAAKGAAPARKPVATASAKKVVPPPRPAAPSRVADEPAARPQLKPQVKPLADPTRTNSSTRPAAATRPAPTVPTATGVRLTPPPSVESEDADGVDSSLLAGPRNVQPYIPKRGEQYMNKVQLEHFRQILLNWKRDLMEEVDRTVSHMKDEAANFPDPNDRATQEEEFSLELRTRDRERKLIRKIDEALKRIEDGSYGYCLETGEEIGIKRLEA